MLLMNPYSNSFENKEMEFTQNKQIGILSNSVSFILIMFSVR